MRAFGGSTTPDNENSRSFSGPGKIQRSTSPKILSRHYSRSTPLPIAIFACDRRDVGRDTDRFSRLARVRDAQRIPFWNRRHRETSRSVNRTRNSFRYSRLSVIVPLLQTNDEKSACRRDEKMMPLERLGSPASLLVSLPHEHSSLPGLDSLLDCA